MKTTHPPLQLILSQARIRTVPLFSFQVTISSSMGVLGLFPHLTCSKHTLGVTRTTTWGVESGLSTLLFMCTW